MILKKPLKSTYTIKRAHKGMNICSVEFQGWRYYMEDSIVLCRNLPSHPGSCLFGVFDGHCSDRASSYLAGNIAERMDELSSLSNENIIQLVRDLDKKFAATLIGGLDSGSTINMVLIENLGSFPYRARVFNLGDSRCFQYDHTNKTFNKLSKDHKPDLKGERKRIENAGGEVTTYPNGPTRINSDLSMSRAFGDKRFKMKIGLDCDEQMVISVCDVKETLINKGDILLLSCDGLYENSLWEEIFEVTKNQLHSLNQGNFDQNLPHDITRSVLKHAIKKGSMDNISVICIAFGDYAEFEREVKFKPCNFLDIVTSSFELLSPYRDFAIRYNIEIKDALIMSLEKFFKKLDKKKSYIKEQNPDLEKILESYSIDVYKQIKDALDYKYLCAFLSENEVHEVRLLIEERIK